MTADKPTLLVCDDEAMLRRALAEHLSDEGYIIVEAKNGEECLSAIAEHAPRAVILDVRMPVMDGLTALRTLREAGNDIPVIVATAAGDVEVAMEATRLGATAYLPKPFDLREISLALRKALDEDRLKTEVRYWRNRGQAGYGDFIGSSSALNEVFATLRRLEQVDPPTVLILGESGTGKDILARAIHARGIRRQEVFVDIDCASIPENLIESELFGHERGAFTDAKTMKRGLFEVAAGGVVFLDEIGEMSLGLQARLLRALESRRFKRVGGVANLEMTASIIAATNRNLRDAVRQGRFREDLYFRLNVIPLVIPPLRERPEDIPELAAHFLERFSRSFGRALQGVTPEAMKLLQRYKWPGNVRELKNVLERIVLLGPEGAIRTDALPPELQSSLHGETNGPGAARFLLPDEGVALEEVEKSLVAQALDRTKGNRTAAARLLGITRYALRYRIEKFGFER